MSDKTVQIAFRVTPEEKKQIEKAAKADRRKMSDWIRITVADAASEQTR